MDRAKPEMVAIIPIREPKDIFENTVFVLNHVAKEKKNPDFCVQQSRIRNKNVKIMLKPVDELHPSEASISLLIIFFLTVIFALFVESCFI